MSDDLIRDVSDTAFWIAHYRAEETERSDALFQDPLAGRLAGERGKRIAEGMHRSRYTRWTVVMRTRVIDQLITAQIAAGVDTVINLGAGLDTRPYRMDLPATLNWVEVDHPKLIAFKEQQLAGEQPRCDLHRIGMDLAQREERVHLFADLGSKTSNALVLTEGVVPYLSLEQAAALASDLHAQPTLRSWVVEYYAPEVFRYLKKARTLNKQMKNAPFQFFPSDWHAFFSENGWKASAMRYLAEESDKVNRPAPMPWLAKLMIRFAPAHRRAASKQYIGFALLTR